VAAGVASDSEAVMDNVDPKKLAKDADIIKAAAEIFGVDTVKVRKWDGPLVDGRSRDPGDGLLTGDLRRIRESC